MEKYPFELYAIVALWCSIIATIIVWFVVRDRKVIVLQFGALLLFLLLIFAASISSAHAGENKIKVNAIITSVHFLPPPVDVRKFNSRQHGWGVEYHIKDTGYYVGGGQFNNSFYHQCGKRHKEMCSKKSSYLGGGVILREDEFARLAFELGLADGYALLDDLKLGKDVAFVYSLTATVEIIDNHALRFSLAGPALVLGYQAGFN